MTLPLRTVLAAALAAATLSGTALAAQPPAPPAPAPSGPVKVQLPKNGPPKAKEPLPTVTEEDEKGPDRKTLTRKGKFQLDFDKVDIDKLVQTISDMTGRLFILPENIRGKEGTTRCGGTGVRVASALRTDSVSRSPNGDLPVAARYSTAPRLNRSHRASTAAPLACSGAM